MTKTLTTPSTPMLGAVDSDRNGHLNRRSASHRQASTIASSKWPIVTRTTYDSLVRGVVAPELSNLRLRRLCDAKAALGRALQPLAGVMHDHRPGQPNLTPDQVEQYAKIWQEARAAHERVEKVYLGWCLEVR